jgi:hypothetical protein
MSGMSTSTLNSSDICLILVACQQTGVKDLQIGDLKVTFQDSHNIERTHLDISLTKPLQNMNNSTKDEPSDTPIQSDMVTLDEEDRLDQLMLSDPAAYEDQVRSILD